MSVPHRALLESERRPDQRRHDRHKPAALRIAGEGQESQREVSELVCQSRGASKLTQADDVSR